MSQPPFPPPDGRTRRSKTPKLIALAVLAFVVVGGAVLLLTRGDGDGDEARHNSAEADSSSPEAVVESYFAAFKAGDCEAMARYISQESLTARGGTREDAIERCRQQVEEGRFETNFTVENIQVTAEQPGAATVEVAATVGEEARETLAEVPLIREGSDWKVDATSFMP